MEIQVHVTPVRCWNPALASFCITPKQYYAAASFVDVAEGGKTTLEKALEYAAWREALAELGAPALVRDANGTVTFVTPKEVGRA